MAALAQFFDPSQPPPAAAEPPTDAGLATRVAKLVEFASRNGPSFVALIQGKQKDNPEYGFLFDGEGSAFYKWSLYSTLSAAAAAAGPQGQQQQQQGEQPGQPQQQTAEHQQTESAQVPPQQQPHGSGQQQYGYGYPQQPQQGHPAAAYGVPPEITSGFAAVLSGLTGSKESVRGGAAWFLGAQQHAWPLAQQMAAHSAQLPEHAKQLHLLYLANDIVLKSLDARAAGSGPESDGVATALRPVLPSMLAATAHTGGLTPEVVARLHQIVDFWASKAVFDAGGAAEMKAAASSGHATPPPTAHYQQQQQQQQYAAQQQQQQQQPGQPYWDGQQWVTPLAGYGQPAPGVSPHTSPHQPGMWGGTSAVLAPPPDLAFAQQGSYGGGQPGFTPPAVAPVAAPTPPLPNPVGFPPGLLPQLVRARQAEGAYTPLTPGDVAAATMPPVREPDAYLKSRLDQFYAELQDYRPGLSRADVEDAQRAQRRADGRPEEAATPRHAEHARTFDGPPPRGSAPADGGSRGGLGSGRIGLGFEDPTAAQQPSNYDNPYDSFRQQRSSGYYDAITRNSVDAMVKRGERFGGGR